MRIKENELFKSMMKDTKEQFEEFFSLMKYGEEERANCFEVFVNGIKEELGIGKSCNDSK